MRTKLFLFALALSILAVPPASAAETIDAVWKEQEVTFTYVSLDVAYSCDLMEARVKMLLRHVGAADDVFVTMPPCPGGNLPQKRHRITARFSTLVPASEGDVDVVKAEWSEVELGKRQPQPIDDRDCELLEFFQKYFLPTIEHEVIDGRVGCGASKYSIVGRLRLKVLKPVVAKVEETAEEPEK